jgi:phosphoenolpyruvate synthase/pyruvate phosphate dikinase
VLPVTLQQPDSTGTLTAIDLAGLTVTFKMINAANGSTKIAATATGISVVSASAGTVNYDFSADGVDSAGVYWGTFLVTESGQTDAVPVRQKDLKIVIDSDTQTGEEAYAAAVAAVS